MLDGKKTETATPTEPKGVFAPVSNSDVTYSVLPNGKHLANVSVNRFTDSQFTGKTKEEVEGLVKAAYPSIK